MKYKATMNLLSPSGYAMPFELSENSPLEIFSQLRESCRTQ